MTILTNEVAEYLGADDAIYDYQLFQIVRWLLERQTKHERVVDLARSWSRDRNRDPWLSSYAMAYLGKFGDTEDLDEIEQGY